MDRLFDYEKIQIKHFLTNILTEDPIAKRNSEPNYLKEGPMEEIMGSSGLKVERQVQLREVLTGEAKQLSKF